MQQNLREAIPALVAVATAGVADAVWGATLVTLLAAGVGAYAAILAMRQPEELSATARPPVRPAASAPLPAAPGRPNLPAGAGQMLLEQLPLGVLLIDMRGHVVFINAAAVEMIGRRPPGDFHSSALRVPRLLEAIDAALEHGVAGGVDFTLGRGRELHLRGHVRPLAGRGLPEAPGRRLSVMVVIEDRTQHRRAEDLHRDFVANASHELKTPLSTVSGIIETLQGHARDDPQASERFFRIMAVQTERMKHLVDDLLSLNRIELNERVFPREPQSLAEIVAEASDAMQAVARTRGASLEVAQLDPGLTVQGSFEELVQVFRNLIENALKYGRDGGRVEVQLAAIGSEGARPGHVGVSVVDDGPGIAREHIPRLTERFYRVSVSRSRAQGGTGLGLAIVKHVLNRHRGELVIESSPGRGSIFTVWLPLTDLGSEAARDAPRVSSAGERPVLRPGESRAATDRSRDDMPPMPAEPADGDRG